MIKSTLFSLGAILLFTWNNMVAQEINYTVSVNTPTLQVADPQVFKALETAVRDFLNNQQWTDIEVKEEERIKCNLQINLAKEFSEKDFQVSLSFLATRPVYGTTYESVIFQFVDERVMFSFEPGSTFIFSPTSYSDPLTSVLAYYSYIILGLDRDSFKDKGGDPMYSRAQDIVSTLPTSIANGDDYGWSVARVGQNKTRASLVENLQSPKLNDFRTGFYEYHRQGLDLAGMDISGSRTNMLNAVKMFEKSYDGYINSMVINLMGNIKGRELAEVFKPAPGSEKSEIYRILLKIDPAGSRNYIDLR